MLMILDQDKHSVRFHLESYQVDHQLFALSKLVVIGDGRDEIIACSWNGQTYILDQDKHSVRFHLEVRLCQLSVLACTP
ncbi:Mitochondrial inner membrane protease subunit 2 [Homalodisca vitripennis]|nr:Mitochondrial inner membrane protease subunit 2 [Homalodisca vitripennis]